MYIVVILLIIGVIGFGYLATNKDVVTKNEDIKTEEEFAVNKGDEIVGTSTEENNTEITKNESKPSETQTLPQKTVSEQKTPETNETKPVVEPQKIVPTPSVVKNYSAEEVYFVSNNKYTIDVTLGVKDGVVTTADVNYGNKETGYEHPLQEKFDGAYSKLVIGKKLEEISLSRVAGASLTTKAFNDAVDKIKSEVNS